MKKLLVVIFFLCTFAGLVAQVEHVSISHPVYNYLLRAESKGYLEHFSLASLPLQRKEIVSALKKINAEREDLSTNEKAILDSFLTEFEITYRKNAVLIYSTSDTVQVFSKDLFSSSEKMIYHYHDSEATVSLSPLASFESWVSKNPTLNDKVFLGNLGFRLHGTLGNCLGFNLKATNGSTFAGNKQVALFDKNLSKNVKFADLNSDFDFTESHVRFDYKWFYAYVGKEHRLLGSGLNQHIFMSQNSPAMDAMSLGVKFSNFEYRYTHGSLLGSRSPESASKAGFNAKLVPKYMAMHRFSFRPAWGEFSFWENIIYSDRSPDLAYLNPLSFFKSVEHSLRDRDNSTMGLDMTVRPISNLQIKASYLLDDIIFSKIGKNYWSNKTAWNIAVISSLPCDLDVGLEYSRVEPYTYSHFNQENSLTNDSSRFASIIPPNSDMYTAMIRWWWGSRYPLTVNISYFRHGKNIVDEKGQMVRNVGGDARRTRIFDEGDSETVSFLDGTRNESFMLGIESGIEIFRGLSFYVDYKLKKTRQDYKHFAKIIIRLGEF